MTKRLFLKLIALLPVGGALGFSNRPREYLAAVRWDQVVGLRFEWPEPSPNPVPGRDWEIHQPCPAEFRFQDDWVRNPMGWKFYCRPVGQSTPIKLLCLTPLCCGRQVHNHLADLSFARCYRP